MKYPLTPAGIEPATFRFVAQHLNHCATAVPKSEVHHPIDVVVREVNEKGQPNTESVMCSEQYKGI